MNVAQAKQIDLPDLLARIGCQQQPVTRQGIWYLSPLRDEKTPSFKVWQNEKGQWCWKDFGDERGGNVIAFANCMIGKETSDRAISEALKWLDDIFGSRVATTPVQRTTAPKSARIEAIQPDRFTLVDNKRLTSPQLLGYLEGRGISRRVAQANCGQANYYDNVAKKKFFGISFPNIGGGLEIRAATAYKHHVNTDAKGFSLIHGQKKDDQSLYMFEGFTDFLSFLMLVNQEKPNSTCIVLNSTAFATQAANHIIETPALSEKIKSVVTFMDNNDAGQKAFDRIAAVLDPAGYKVGDYRYLYADHGLEDLNNFLTDAPAEARAAFTRAPAKFFDTSATAELRRSQDIKP